MLSTLVDLKPRLVVVLDYLIDVCTRHLKRLQQLVDRHPTGGVHAEVALTGAMA